jgi:hypothetical protein
MCDKYMCVLYIERERDIERGGGKEFSECWHACWLAYERMYMCVYLHANVVSVHRYIHTYIYARGAQLSNFRSN